MAHFPLFEGNSHIETIQTAGNSAEDLPDDPLAEKFCAGTVERQTLPIDNCMLFLPPVDLAEEPGCCDPAGN